VKHPHQWKEEEKIQPSLADAIMDRLRFHGGLLVSDLMENFARSEKAIRKQLVPLVKTGKISCNLPINKQTHIRFVKGV